MNDAVDILLESFSVLSLKGFGDRGWAAARRIRHLTEA